MPQMRGLAKVAISHQAVPCSFSFCLATSAERDAMLCCHCNWQVAVVSLALSIGLGIASGLTPVEGLRTAIFGGLCASLFGAPVAGIPAHPKMQQGRSLQAPLLD